MNGLRLGEAIQSLFNISSNPQICWTGLNTQSGEPIDLIIDGLKFSLKEESYILENMGLYQLINLITGTNKYRRGTHIFLEFAYPYFNAWFHKTRDLLIKYGPLPYPYRGSGYTSNVTLLEGKNLILQYDKGGNSERSIIYNFPSADYDTFFKSTTSTTREKVFSKWIKANVERNKEYLQYKLDCANKAGEALIQILRPFVNTSPDSLSRLFRIGSEEYYYAKTTSKITEIYKVPDKKSFKDNVHIKDISYKVPSHQLNIHTIIENRDTMKQIEFRNELRYSHGQFNGTPEAKFYIVAQQDITTLYKKLF